MFFEWDGAKAGRNFVKHGVRFEEAVTIFDDPFGLRVRDYSHSRREFRYWQIGESDAQILLVVFTIRGVGRRKRIRIISARKASRKERVLYEINKGIPF